MTGEVRTIRLRSGQHNNSVIHRLPKDVLVRFVPDSSALRQWPLVFEVQHGGGVQSLEWQHGSDSFEPFVEVPLNAAGTYHYNCSQAASSRASICSGYILVIPQLSDLGATPLEGISCITHITKLLGPLSQWDSRLGVVAAAGYNMIHLTPIHGLGISNSAYSLVDHHAVATSLSEASGESVSFDDVEAFLKSFTKKHGIVFVQDVVWNHAAKNAQWLQEHPECTYNCFNSPHLRKAYVLDRAYHYFGAEVAAGKWEHRGIPAVVDNVHHIHSIKYALKSEVLPALKFHEFYQCDVEARVREFEAVCRLRGPEQLPAHAAHLELLPSGAELRFGRVVDLQLARALFNKAWPDVQSEEERILRCAAVFRSALEHLNAEGAKHCWEVLMAGLSAALGHIAYERIDHHGPRKGAVTVDNPLLCDYFLHNFPEASWYEDEKLAFDDETAQYLFAFNGWVMGHDPMKNFALANSEVYVRRELVCWGDSAKLNYGDSPEDCPFLWNYMKEYTVKIAQLFAGIRIDNAHSTPKHVAAYLLTAARQIRPDLYVFAELFTGSEEADHDFVNSLGITSLIREALSAPDSHEQGRLVYRFGGECMAAMKQKAIRPAEQNVAHAMLLDQSHDNPSPIQKRSVHDLLPTAAMVAMASCAVGTTRGYDELIHVVSEKRLYSAWQTEVTEASGIVRARKVLNSLHQRLAQEGYTQVYVDQMNKDIVGITRHNPDLRKTVVLVAHTAFFGEDHSPVQVKWIPVGGKLQDILFEMRLIQAAPDSVPERDDVLIGLSNFTAEVRENVSLSEAQFLRLHDGKYIELTNFPSSAVLCYSVVLEDAAQSAIDSIRGLNLSPNHANVAGLSQVLDELDLEEFTALLFCSDSEERALISQGAFDIPRFGQLPYCGLQGIVPLLNKIRETNDLGHPLCQNLRDGVWLPEYYVNRLRKRGPRFAKTAAFLQALFSPLVAVPYYLRPCYFEQLISWTHTQILNKLCKISARKAVSVPQTDFGHQLLLSALSFVSRIPGAGLVPTVEGQRASISLAAGLPHFATGIWRNWGRDTFIALRGILLLAGRFDEAKQIILHFAGTMRHGLIPNLVAEGRGARFNCRDATWFWLYAITKFVDEAPDGASILDADVERMYASADSEYGVDTRREKLKDTMVEAAQRHFAGIAFRERNAGHSIDEHMRDEGFNVSAFVDRNTGFIHGGNAWNCGTWMDKMGSSEQGGNRGFPATPRDGAAVEIQGLALAVLRKFDSWARAGLLSRSGVAHDDQEWSWFEWAQKIAASFPQQFLVAADSTEEFANKREIIKDTVGSSHRFTDFQLRPNAFIAIAAAPDILPAEQSWKALSIAHELLAGPLGIKTLDPTDWAYNDKYDNEYDGPDRKIAKGWNYHQGPEWLWLTGYYIMARLAIAKRLGPNEQDVAAKEASYFFVNHHEHLTSSSWSSLPELTQEDGAECHHSCPAQAWSIGTILEAYVEFSRFRSPF